MKLCSITVTSSTKESIIADCMRSVSFCDMNLIVHMVPVNQDYQDDRTLEIVRSIAGHRYREVTVPIQPGDTIEVFRNAGLDEAARLGADWAVQCDTDDRIILNRLNVHKTLEMVDPGIQGLTCYSTDGETDRALFFRLPAQGKYINGVHEDFSLPITHAIPRARFSSLPKTKEQIEARYRADVVGLAKQMEEEPDNPRWPYYLGITWENLGEYTKAIENYRQACSVFKDTGMIGWCHFRMALILNDHMKDPKSSLWTCMAGLLQCAHIPELPIMAGVCCHAMGEYDNAEWWAKMALAHTWTKRIPELQRIGPKSIGAYFEGPYKLLEAVYHAKGQATLESWAKKESMRAFKQRMTFCERGTP